MLKFRELCVTLHGILEKRHNWMKQIKTTYLLIAMLLGTLASCTSTDDDTTVTLYDDAAITSFQLGTMNRYVNDEKTTFKGSDYLFHIDQINRTIFNTDSLPLGTDITKVVCYLSTYNNSSPFLVSQDGTYMTYYAGTDSIDFSTPRTFCVASSSNVGYTNYTVKVNVHQKDPDAFEWQKMANVPVMTGLRALSFNDRIYVFGNEGGTTKAYYTEDGTSWTPATLPALTDADAWGNAVANLDSLYIMDGTNIYRSADVNTWVTDGSKLPDGITLECLLGASSTEVYAIDTNGSLITKYCGGQLPLWIEAKDETESSFDALPTQDITMVSYPLNLSDSTDYVLMAGNKQTDDTWNGQLWRRIVDYSETGIISLLEEYITTLIEGKDDYPEWIRKWTYVDRADDHRYELPALENIQLVRYDDVLLAFGGMGLNGTPTDALRTIYISRDNGITWKEATYSMPPTDGNATFNSAATSFSATADGNYIWIVCAGTGEVWRGQLNRVAWGE